MDPWLLSFESKVCHVRYEATTQQDTEKRPNQWGVKRVSLTQGRPAIARTGEKRLHRQKSNYGESYRQQCLCQAGISP